MPLTTETYKLRRVCELVDKLPPEVKSAVIVTDFDTEETFTVKWDDELGHVITWKEPRK